MARLPYADLQDPAIKPLAQRIAQERGSVLHLYQMLLHSPSVAGGWLSYLTAIRHHCSLPGSLRELVIMRVAILNGASYEAEQHAPIALAEGLSQPQLDALPEWENSTSFTAGQREVLAYTDAMTQHIQVPDAVFDAVARRFSNQELIELTATIAAYNMVSRFLEALQVHSTDTR